MSIATRKMESPTESTFLGEGHQVFETDVGKYESVQKLFSDIERKFSEVGYVQGLVRMKLR